MIKMVNFMFFEFYLNKEKIIQRSCVPFYQDSPNDNILQNCSIIINQDVDTDSLETIPSITQIPSCSPFMVTPTSLPPHPLSNI